MGTMGMMTWLDWDWPTLPGPMPTAPKPTTVPLESEHPQKAGGVEEHSEEAGNTAQVARITTAARPKDRAVGAKRRSQDVESRQGEARKSSEQRT